MVKSMVEYVRTNEYIYSAFVICFSHAEQFSDKIQFILILI